jgi:GT2 family glycosyltransferase
VNNNFKPKIGLVTVLYNGIEVLEDFFTSLSKQTYQNFILYVIDNSPDDSVLMKAKRLSKLYNLQSIFINNNNNLGCAKGNNQGILQSIKDDCKYTLLLNNDIEFTINTISSLVDIATLNDEYLVVPKILYHNTNKIWMAGGNISKIRALSHHRGEGEEDTGQYNLSEYINYAPTCFILINNEVFNKIGFMDEKYFVYSDDTDFIFRAVAYGYKLLYCPQSVVGHKVSVSTGGDDSLFSIYYSNRNRVYFIKKNFTLFYKLTSLSYFYITRIIKYINYDKDRKKTLLRAIKDGFVLR